MIARRRFLSGLGAALAGAALAGAAPAGPGAALAWPMTDVAGAFSMPLPPGARVIRAAADGISGRVEAPGFALRFDRSPWNGPFVALPRYRRFEARDATIDGRPARILRAVDAQAPARARHLLALFAPGIDAGPVGPVNLGLSVTAPSPAMFDRIADAMRAIRLP